MQNGYKENYADMILMYPISAQPKDKSETGGAFDRTIEKSNKAIKLHSIQAKPVKKAGWRNNPKMVKWQSQEEYNPFLKKCWMLMGEAQFYNADFLQASATFSYICRHYKEDEEIVAMAKLWQARCYAEMGWFYESEDILNKLNTNGIPKKNLNQYAAVYADYLIKNQRFEEAIPYMKTAIEAEKNALQRKRHIRPLEKSSVPILRMNWSSQPASGRRKSFPEPIPRKWSRCCSAWRKAKRTKTTLTKYIMLWAISI